MREMVDDYTKQLELRDDTIKRLELNSRNEVSQQTQLASLRREIDDLQQENHSLRTKVSQMSRDLMDKERFIEKNAADQKNEWAEIYGGQKQALEKLERENMMLVQENTSLKRQLDQKPPNFGGDPAGGPSSAEFAE